MRLRFIAGKGEMDAKLDRKHTRRLKQIIKKYGWPTKSLVGRKASHAAWLLAQHADRELPFQKKVLKMLNEIYKNNKKEINPANVAYLTDRVLLHEHKPQVFGTQFRWNKKGKLEPRPIKDRKNVNKRRKKYSLPTLEQNTREINQAYGKSRG